VFNAYSLILYFYAIFVFIQKVSCQAFALAVYAHFCVPGLFIGFATSFLKEK